MSDTDAGGKADRLTQLLAPPTSALLVQEMQRGVVGSSSGLPALAEAGADIDLIDHVAAVVKAARRSGVTVVHCTAENLPGGFGVNRNARVFAAARKAGMENAPGSESVRPVPEMGPEPGDVILPRYHGLSPLTGSPLDTLLRNQGVTTTVVVGVSLNVAIPNLVFDAVNRSYQVVVVSDAVVGVPVDYGRQVLANSLSLVATLASTDEVVAAWRAGKDLW
ncbi:MAG TPA: isochorismatase family protein [Acidimicrobiales bacterium]|jgi:nicotinamidase-related amidase|nr:isochorismatase family protein [Acidimicrobiales bacterium]